jgi:hypothetical protein
MDKKKEELIELLRKEVGTDNFIDITYDVVDEMKKSKEAFDFVEPILQFMEDYPEADFGNPGPLVHFVELFYRKGYEKLLFESVKRKPTMHTIWMVNRIINDPKFENKEIYINLLKDVLNSNSTNKEIKDLVLYFIRD